MKGGTRRRATSTPLIHPGTMVAPSAMTTPATSPMPGPAAAPTLFATWAEMTAAKPMVKPTDRSMPPEIMTSVWPRPSSTGATAKTAMERILKGLKRKVLP